MIAPLIPSPDIKERVLDVLGRLRKKNVRPETPHQAIVRRFDGLSYFTLTDEEIEIFRVMRRLGYVDFDTEGEISATKRGRGIIDGSIATNYEAPCSSAITWQGKGNNRLNAEGVGPRWELSTVVLNTLSSNLN